MKQYYQDSAVTLYHGDCREMLPGMAAASVVVTDPPYGFGAYETDDDAAVVPVLSACLAMSRSAAVFGYPETLVSWCVALGAVPDEWVTWWPTNKPLARGSARLPKSSECVAIFGETPGVGEIVRRRSEGDSVLDAIHEGRGHSLDLCRDGDVWREASPGAGFNYHLRRHPNEKPLELMNRLVLLCSLPGATVLDPFAGSGTTLRAAKDLGRRAIGIEIEERYCEIAAKRCAQETLFAPEPVANEPEQQELTA